MEWYVGSVMDDLVVPKDQELSDGLPSSPESWLKWGSYATQNFLQPNKCFGIENANMIDESFNLDGFFCNNKVDSMETSPYSSVLNVSKESLQQRIPFAPDQQLDHLAGIEHLDDIYLNSLLEDLPRGEDVHKSFYFNSSNDLSSEMIVDSNNRNMGSSKYLKTHAFSPSSANLDKGEVASSITYSNTDSGEALSAKVLVPSEHSNTSESVGDETSHEESVLQELKMAMAQFTDKTRLHFRDALYRLAKNSKENEASVSQNSGLDTSHHSPPCESHDINMRTNDRKSTELETNSIDRAVASLMFNRMDSNAPVFPVTDSINPAGSEESKDCSSYSFDQQYVGQLCRAVLDRDAEVPTFGQKNPQTDSKWSKQFSNSYATSNP